MQNKKWIIRPEVFAIIFMWLVVFEWFGTGLPQIHYLIRISYLLILFQWLVAKFKSRDDFPIPKAAIPLALILFQQIISIPNSPLPFHGLEVVLGYLILGIGFLYLLDLLRHDIEPRKLEITFFSMAAVFCLFNLLDILNWFRSWWDISGSMLSLPPFGYRLKGVFLHHANVEAAFLNLVVPLIFVRLLCQRKLFQRFLWLLFMVIIVIVEYFASSRGGWLAAISGLGVTSILLLAPVLKRAKDTGLSLFKDWFSSKGRLISTVILLTILIVGGSVFLGQLRSTSHAPIASARSEIWNTSWQIFKESPIFGNGAGSMHILPVVEDQLPPGFYLVHAHNVLLQVAAENGVIGVGLLMAAVGWGLKAFFHSWRSVEGQARIDLAAYAGVWVGMGVHNLVDVAFEAPIYILATGVFLAFVYRHAPAAEHVKLHRRWILSGAGIFLCVYLIGILFTLRGSIAHQRGVADAAENNDWQGVSENLCEAVDQNPHNSYFYFQCALAKARVYQDSGEAEMLQSAIEILEEGLQIDPYWPVHRANLAILQWEDGQTSQAIETMLQATIDAPNNAVFTLNLGSMYASLGQNEEAAEAYQHALRNDPWLIDSLFMSSDNLRSELMPVSPEDATVARRKQMAWEGWIHLHAGRYNQAEESFQQSLWISPDYGLAYAGLALLAEARGEPEQARIDAGTAVIADVDTPRVYLAAGQIAERQGRTEEATRMYLLTYWSASHTSFSKQYYASVYRRLALPFDLVPQTELGILTDDMLQSFNTLADELEELGQDDLAQQVQDWVVENTP